MYWRNSLSVYFKFHFNDWNRKARKLLAALLASDITDKIY